MATAMVTASSSVKIAAHLAAVDALGGCQVLVDAPGATAAARARRRPPEQPPHRRDPGDVGVVTANTSPNRKPTRSTGGPLSIDMAMTPAASAAWCSRPRTESRATTCCRPNQRRRKATRTATSDDAKSDVELKREAQAQRRSGSPARPSRRSRPCAARRRSTRAAPQRRRAPDRRRWRARETAQARSSPAADRRSEAAGSPAECATPAISWLWSWWWR